MHTNFPYTQIFSIHAKLGVILLSALVMMTKPGFKVVPLVSIHAALTYNIRKGVCYQGIHNRINNFI